MSLFFPKTITAYHSPGGYTNGVWSDTPSDPFTLEGSVQPLSPREYANLPSGRQDIGMMKIYTETTLKVSEEAGSQNGDIIEWQGRYWEVVSEDNNQNGIIDHKKYTAQYKGTV